MAIEYKQKFENERSFLMTEKIKIVLKVKDNPSDAALKQREREAAVIRKADTVYQRW